jgi:hypothetical protein
MPWSDNMDLNINFTTTAHESWSPREKVQSLKSRRCHTGQSQFFALKRHTNCGTVRLADWSQPAQGFGIKRLFRPELTSIEPLMRIDTPKQ